MEELTKLLNIAYNKIRPARGKILISQPLMMDGCFHRSVVLLTEYSKKCAVGFILNKILPISLEDIMEDFPDCEANLTIGGPVSFNTLHYLHTFENIPGAIEIVEGVYWGGDLETLRQVSDLGLREGKMRYFLGYSGWVGNQLDEELEKNSWLVADVSASQIINPSQDLWEDVVQSMGEQYRHWMEFPEDPGMN